MHVYIDLYEMRIVMAMLAMLSVWASCNTETNLLPLQQTRKILSIVQSNDGNLTSLNASADCDNPYGCSEGIHDNILKRMIIFKY